MGRRVLYLETLEAIASLSASLDATEVLQRIAGAAATTRPGALAVVHALVAERQVLRSAASAGVGWDDLPPEFPAAAGLPGLVAEQQAPALVPEPAGHPRTLARDWWRGRLGATYYGVPIVAGESLVGVLSFILPDGVPDEEEQEALRLLAAQAGIALRNASLYREAQRRREIAEALARLGRELSRTLDVEHIADLVARGVVELLGGRASTVYRYQPTAGTLETVAAHGRAPLGRGAVLGPGEGAAGLAVAERRIVVTGDILTDPGIRLSPAVRERIAARASGSVVAVPLVVGECPVGALTMGAERGRRFSGDDLQVLQAFADQAALALENARLYASARDSVARLRETQAQLVQAAKMSALGQLVSGVAHELNNPLSVIIGYGQLLLARNVAEPLRRPIELMVAQGERMARIVRNLLYFARQRPPERTAVDLNQVIEQTLTLRLHQLTLASITVNRELAPHLPSVIGDGQQLQQVILNLLLNAEQAVVGAGRAGQIVFRTSAVDSGRRVRVDVTDDGPGIPPEVLPRVFEPFFTTKEVGAGTGLGLSVSYGIVEEHGGRLSVESRPGRTVFTLELPVGRPVAVLPAPPPPAPLRSAGRRALLVEDEPSVVDLVATLLREEGWSVDIVSGGHAGLEQLGQRRYDLIVSDIRMRDGGGEEFYRAAVAAQPALARRFLFITGDTANLRTLEFFQTTQVPVLEKPFTPAAFLDAVRRVATALTASGASA